MKTTKQEDELITLFANYFVEIILDGEFKFSDDTEDLQISVTEEFLKELREILDDGRTKNS